MHIIQKHNYNIFYAYVINKRNTLCQKERRKETGKRKNFNQ